MVHDREQKDHHIKCRSSSQLMQQDKWVLCACTGTGWCDTYSWIRISCQLRNDIMDICKKKKGGERTRQRKRSRLRENKEKQRKGRKWQKEVVKRSVRLSFCPWGSCLNWHVAKRALLELEFKQLPASPTATHTHMRAHTHTHTHAHTRTEGPPLV